MRRNQDARLRHWTVGLTTLLLGGLLTVSAAVRLSAQPSDVTRVSVNSAGGEANADSFFPALSADGRIVGFKSSATNLDNTLPDDTQFDVFVHDRENGQTSRASLTSLGFVGNDNSFPPALDDSGNLVAFASNATNMVPNDRNGGADVFVRNREAATTEAVSLTSAGTLPLAGGSRDLPPSITGDGSIVAFETTAILTPDDPNTDIADVYVRDRVLGATELISVRTVTRDPQPALAPAISRDGCIVAFVSPSDRLIPQGGDPNEKLDVYVRDRCADPAVTELATIGFDGSPTTRDSQSSLFPPGITDDGALVAFESLAINLVPDDTNDVSDVFIRNRANDTNERVSVNSYGDQANGPSTSPAISGDGRYVVFVSNATNFVEGTDGRANIYVRDRQTNQTCQVSLADGVSPVAGDSVNPAISRDGRWISFESTSVLVPGGTPGRRGIYIVENSEENQNCPEPATPTVTLPPATQTPGPNDCCQCPEQACELPSEGACPESCDVVFQAACAEGNCITFTPTPEATPTQTPGENDCCQCAGAACELPSDGTCPESCGVVYQAACLDGEGCATFTPTPPGTPTPTLGENDCCQCPDDPDLCAVPSSGECPAGCDAVYDAACVGAPQGCVANTPTPTRTPTRVPGENDCCACPEGPEICTEPAEGGCPTGCNPVYDAACLGEAGCFANTATPTATATGGTVTSTVAPSTPTPTVASGTPTVTRTPTSGGGGGGGGGCGCETNPQPRNMGMLALRDLVALFGPLALLRLRRRRAQP